MIKFFVFLLVLFLIPTVSSAQNSCCQTSANAKFAALGSSRDFVASHPDPIPMIANNLAGSMISFKCPSGHDGSAYFVKSAKHPDIVILMFHEWWGLNDYIKASADSLSNTLNVSVCAVDLYDGNVATTKEEATKYMQALTPDRGNAIIDGAMSHFGKQIHFGTIGWCMGGGWSQQAALRGGRRVEACVIYYGMPETDTAKLANLHAHVLGIFGTKDKWITPKVVADFQDAMKKAHKRSSIHSYDADHGFANPSNPIHDKEATADAMRRTISYFKREMQIF